MDWGRDLKTNKQRVWLKIMETEAADLGVEISYNVLPLIIRPRRGQESAEHLKSWVAENKEWLKNKLLQHGTRFRDKHLNYFLNRCCYVSWVHSAGRSGVPVHSAVI